MNVTNNQNISQLQCGILQRVQDEREERELQLALAISEKEVTCDGFARGNGLGQQVEPEDVELEEEDKMGTQAHLLQQIQEEHERRNLELAIRLSKRVTNTTETAAAAIPTTSTTPRRSTCHNMYAIAHLGEKQTHKTDASTLPHKPPPRSKSDDENPCTKTRQRMHQPDPLLSLAPRLPATNLDDTSPEKLWPHNNHSSIIPKEDQTAKTSPLAPPWSQLPISTTEQKPRCSQFPIVQHHTHRHSADPSLPIIDEDHDSTLEISSSSFCLDQRASLMKKEVHLHQLPSFLQDKLEAEVVILNSSFPSLMADLKTEIRVLKQARVSDAALHVGDLAPHFVLQGVGGLVVDTKKYLKRGPLIVTFYHGDWSSLCQITMSKLNKHLSEFQSEGADLVAIRPPPLANTKSSPPQVDFPILSDKDRMVAKNFGIKYHLDAELPGKEDSFPVLPMTSTFIVGKDKTILWAFVDCDHTKRAEPCDILEALLSVNENKKHRKSFFPFHRKSK